MRQSGWFVALILIGLGAASVLSIDLGGLSHSPAFTVAIYLLLAVGLFGATSGLDLSQARHESRTILFAVTAGVVLKALIIGGVLALAWQDPLYLLLGIVVAQIDPIWAGTLADDPRFSPRTRTVLTAWAAFDSPFTVVLSLTATAVVTDVFGLDVGLAKQSAGAGVILPGVIDFGLNLAVVAVFWLLWRWIRPSAAWLQALTVGIALATAVVVNAMLAIALIGLFARPAFLERVLPKVTGVVLAVASVLLGVTMIGGVALAPGIALGVCAFAAQALVALPLTRSWPALDRWHIAFAQQNGITAIVLALSLELQFSGVLAVVAPAIVAANLLHVIANTIIDRRTAGQPPYLPSLRP